MAESKSMWRGGEAKDLWNNKCNVNLSDEPILREILSLMFQLKVFYWKKKSQTYPHPSRPGFAVRAGWCEAKRFSPNVYLAPRKVSLLLLGHFIIQADLKVSLALNSRK